jgi:NTP pyrophosphatase (non-canonical NTP hydrolase)
MEFKQLNERALTIRQKYTAIETKRYGREWTTEELTLGFMKDVGDLARLVQAHAGIRDVKDLQAATAHELSDRLWSVNVLADKLEINLETAFIKTMDELDEKLEVRS